MEMDLKTIALLEITFFCDITHDIHTKTKEKLYLIFEKIKNVKCNDDSGSPSTTTTPKFVRFKVWARKVCMDFVCDFVE